MGAEIKINYFPERKEVKYAYSDHSKINNFFSYHSKYSIEEGLKKMTKWAKKVGAKQSKKFDNIEIVKNLPSAWL